MGKRSCLFSNAQYLGFNETGKKKSNQKTKPRIERESFSDSYSSSQVLVFFLIWLENYLQQVMGWEGFLPSSVLFALPTLWSEGVFIPAKRQSCVSLPAHL